MNTKRVKTRWADGAVPNWDRGDIWRDADGIEWTVRGPLMFKQAIGLTAVIYGKHEITTSVPQVSKSSNSDALFPSDWIPVDIAVEEVTK